jgi:hypothetical protein
MQTINTNKGKQVTINEEISVEGHSPVPVVEDNDRETDNDKDQNNESIHFDETVNINQVQEMIDPTSGTKLMNEVYAV